MWEWPCKWWREQEWEWEWEWDRYKWDWKTPSRMNVVIGGCTIIRIFVGNVSSYAMVEQKHEAKKEKKGHNGFVPHFWSWKVGMKEC